MKPREYLSDEYLDRCKKMTTEQIVRFLDDFRLLRSPHTLEESTPIALVTSEELFRAFRVKCELEGVKYQTQIKRLMSEWIGVEN